MALYACIGRALMLMCAVGCAIASDACAQRAAHGDGAPAGLVARLGTVYAQHWRATALAFSPKGQLLVSAGTDGRMRTWNGRTGALVKTLAPIGARRLTDLALAPDGNMLAAIGTDGFLRIWDVRSEECRFEARISQASLRRLTWSPNAGEHLATVEDYGVIRLWTLTRDAEQLSVSAGPTYDGTAVALSPDGRWLAYGGGDQVIHLRSLDTGEEKLIGRGHGRSLTSIRFVKDGRHLVADGYRPVERAGERTGEEGGDQCVAVWDVSTGRLDRTLRIEYRSECGCWLEFSDDAGILAGITDREILIWQTDTWELLHTIRREIGKWIDPPVAALSADGRRLATSDNQYEIHLWDPVRGEKVAPDQPSHPLPVMHVATSAGGERVATASPDGTVFVWSPPNESPLRRLEVRGLRSLAISPDGRTIVLGVDDSHKPSAGGETDVRGHCVLRKIETGEVLRELQLAAAPTAVAFSRDGRLLVIAATRSANPFTDQPERDVRRSLIVWDVAEGEPRYELATDVEDVASVRIAAEGRRVAGLLPRKSAWLWDPRTARQLGQIQLEARPAALGPSGETVLVADDGRNGAGILARVIVKVIRGIDAKQEDARRSASIVVRSIATGKPVRQWDLQMSRPTLLAVSTSGAVAVVGREDAAPADAPKLEVYSASTGELVHSSGLPVDCHPISLAFSPDGRHLVIGLVDGTALVWDTTASGSESAALND